MTMDKDALLRLAYEMDGLVEDYRLGIFDDTCIRTVIRVRDALRAAAIAEPQGVMVPPKRYEFDIDPVNQAFNLREKPDGRFMLSEEVDALLAAAKEPQGDGWIKCSERLPEIDVPVLVYEPGQPIQKTCRDEYDWFLPHKSNVTHWRPLPPLPRSE